MVGRFVAHPDFADVPVLIGVAGQIGGDGEGVALGRDRDRSAREGDDGFVGIGAAERIFRFKGSCAAVGVRRKAPLGRMMLS